MSVGRICTRDVDLADPEESVQIAARRMNSRNVGSLLVVDSDSRPIGIVTDRDLALRVVGKGLDVAETMVRDIMTRPPDAVSESTPIEMALTQMRAGHFRRLPVVADDGRLLGLVSLDDILMLLSEELGEIGRLLRHESPDSLAGMP